MKFFFASLFVAAFAVTSSQCRKTKAEWNLFKQAHGKAYDNATDALREEIFQRVDAQIEAHNNRTGVHFRRAHNKFSDMTETEMVSYLGVKSPSSSDRFLQQLAMLTDADDLSSSVEDRQLPPASLDYRSDSCLGAVKNQGSCGSCWAFSAIAPLEFARCKKYSTATVLSEQQLVDCDPYDSGCGGGWYTNAWYYLKNVAGGSAKQALYTYTATKAATCKFTTSMVAAKVASYGYVQSNNAVAMQVALQKYGPLSVAIAVANPFFSYSSGVYTDSTCDAMSVNHGVVVVGWGTLNGINYWVVRNSWGATWGQKGYVLMQRGVNKCKIETYAAYVTVA